MTRKAGYPLGRTPWASGEAGIGVVDVRSALPPTAVYAPSLTPPPYIDCYRHLTWHSGRHRASVCVCGGTGAQVAVAGPLAL